MVTITAWISGARLVWCYTFLFTIDTRKLGNIAGRVTNLRIGARHEKKEKNKKET